MGYANAPCRQFVPQPMQRQMRLLVDPADDEGPVRLKNSAPVPAHLTRCNTPGPAVELRPLHHARNRNLKSRRNSAATLARRYRRNNPLA